MGKKRAIDEMIKTWELEDNVVVDPILALLHEQVIEHERRLIERGENVVWITDLLRCSQKRIFEEKLGLVQMPTFEMLHGTIVHEGLEMLCFVKFGWAKEVEFEKEVADRDLYEQTELGEKLVHEAVEGRVWKVHGRVDMADGKRIYEIKTLSVIPSAEVSEHYRRQCEFLNWLADADECMLIELSHTGYRKTIIREKATEEDVLRAIIEFKAPRWTWECRYCQYSRWCQYKVGG